MLSDRKINSYAVKENKVVLYSGEQLVYECDLSEFLWYSVTYPWEYRKCTWRRIQCVTGETWAGQREQEENRSILVYEDDILKGEVTLTLEDHELKVEVSVTNCGREKLEDLVLGISLPVLSGGKHKVTIPHLIYNDNPSADPERIVAHIGDKAGEGIIVEEHRLPIPAVNMEWESEGEFSFLTMLSFPQVKDGRNEEYWSLGVLKEEQGERIVALSGPVMFNGMKDVIYGAQNTPMSYMKGYRSLAPGEGLSKTYFISWGRLQSEGKGFRNLTDTGYRILKPKTAGRHTAEEMIQFKKQVLDSRYYEKDGVCGYLTFGTANAFGNISGRPEYFLYGWTGQAVRLAWCDCMLGIQSHDQKRLDRGIGVADFYVKNCFGSLPGLVRGYYVIDKNSWQGDWKNREAGLNSRIEGESLSDLLELMLLLRQHQIQVPACWEEMVRKACDFLMDEKYQTRDGIYPLEWQADGEITNEDINAAGMPCVLTLVKAYEYFRQESYLEYAQDKYEIYAQYHMKTFERPFARATMDARCEDKEAGIYFFTTAAELYYLTQKEIYREYAGIAADWILTFVFYWETGFQKGTACDENRFHTTGWPGVSVQNHHLDVFFPTYELYRFGCCTDNEQLRSMAEHIRDALTYGVCTREGQWGYSLVGEQGEQYYQTNYFQLTYPRALKYIHYFRGGMQAWNPSWITAQVMSTFLKFQYGKD